MRVFISYSRGDSEAADRMAEALESLEYSVTIDRCSLPYGEEWQGQLATLIRACDTVVWLVSERSTGSKWCQWELGEAQRESKRLIPVRIDPVDASELPEALGKIHCLPAVGCYDPDQHLQDLHAALLADHAWISEHTRLSDRAVEWVAGERPGDKLIRGESLRAAEAWVDRKPEGAPPVLSATLEFLLASRRAEQRRERQSQERAIRIAEQRAQLLCSIADQQQDPIVAALIALEAWSGGGGEFEGFAELDRFLDARGDSWEGVPMPSPEALDDLPDYSGPASRLAKFLSTVREDQGFGDWEQGKLWEVALEARRIAVFKNSGKGTVWDLDTGEEVAMLRAEVDSVHPAETIQSLALSTDGVFAAVGTSKGRLHLWRVDGGRAFPGLTLEGRTAGPLIFQPGRSVLVCGSSRGDLFALDLKLLSDNAKWYETEGAFSGLSTFEGQVDELQFSADGRYFVSAGGEKQQRQLRVLDLNEGRLVMTAQLSKYIGSLSLSADGTRIAARIGTEQVVVWSVPSGEVIYETEVRPGSWGLRITADGKHVLIPTRGGEIELQPVDGGPSRTLLSGGGRVHDVLQIPERGQFVASFDTGAVRIWNEDGKTPELEIYTQERFSCDGLVWDASRERLIGTSNWGQSRVWNIDKYVNAPRQSELASRQVDVLRFSIRGDYVVGATNLVPGIAIWSVSDGRLVHERSDVQLQPVLTMDSTGSRFVGTCEQSVVVLALKDGSLEYPPAFRGVRARGAVATTDGKSVVASSHRQGLGFGGLGAEDSFVAFQGEVRGTVLLAEKSRELPLLLTVSSEGDVDLWDVNDGRQLGHIELASPTVNPSAASFHETERAVRVAFTDGTGIDLPLTLKGNRWRMSSFDEGERFSFADEETVGVLLIPHNSSIQIADLTARKLIYDAPRDGQWNSPVANSPQAGCTAEWVEERGQGGRVWFRKLPPLVARSAAPRMWAHQRQAFAEGRVVGLDERRMWQAERQRWLFREASRMLTRRLCPFERKLLGLELGDGYVEDQFASPEA